MDLNGVEIFAVGRWNNIKTFSEDDLDAMAASFAELSLTGRVPLKLGHNGDQPLTDGQPALGWVSRVWREGGKLLADFTSMPRAVYDAVKGGLYKFVSVELLRDVVFQGSEYPWVLSGVALLGADIPAVSGLKDLQALAMSRRAEFRSGARLTFTREVQPTGDRKHMSDDKEKPDLNALVARVEDLSNKLATFSSDNAKLKADNDRLVREAKEREDAIRKEKVKLHREAIGLRFSQAIKARRILPVAQALFEKNPAYKSDDSVLELTLDFVDGYIKDNTVQGWKQPAAGKGDDELRDAMGGSSLPGVTDENAPPDVQMTQVVGHLMANDLRFKGATYFTVADHVARAYPELAEKYRMQPGIKGEARS